MINAIRYKRTRNRKEAKFVKAHFTTGVETNIVTAVEIGDRDAGDSPYLKRLVETTAKNFTITDVPAGKAYLSRENLGLVDRLGGTAFVPFKSNSVQGEAGTLWERCSSSPTSNGTNS